MVRHVIHTSYTPRQLYGILSRLPYHLAHGGGGTILNQASRGLRMRLAYAFFSKIKQAFIVKSRGGTDGAGIKWKKLSRDYLAYGKDRRPLNNRRRFARGEKADLKRGAGLRASNRYAPGGQTGLLSKAQLKRWNYLFVKNLGWLTTRYSFTEAKSHAAAIAWNQLKREGAQTKLNVFGNRQVEMLRDTGLLFNSLNPGKLREDGHKAHYSPASREQVVASIGDTLFVGTNVAYAGPNHRRRPLWPSANNMPQAWLDDFQEQAARGIDQTIQLLAGSQ